MYGEEVWYVVNEAVGVAMIVRRQCVVFVQKVDRCMVGKWRLIMDFDS